MKNNQTEQLLKKLNNIKDINVLKEYISTSMHERDNSMILSEYILEVCRANNIEKNNIIKNSNLYRTYGYEILGGRKLPSRDKILQICIGNKFSLEETNRCLTIGKLGVLYAKDPRDSIIIFALNNNLKLIEANFILDEHDFKILD